MEAPLYALRAFTHLLIFCCLLMFTFEWFWWQSDGSTVSVRWATFTSKVAIPYKYGARSKTTLMPGSYTVFVITQWLPVFTAAVLVALLQALPKPTESRASLAYRVKAQIKRFFKYQLPPRRFWAWWCEGLSILDAIVVITVLGAASVPLASLKVQYWKPINTLVQLGIGLPGPLWRLKLEKLSLAISNSAKSVLWVLFFPVAHTSFLTLWTGMPFNALIRYHRWLGHLLLVMITMHGVFQYACWFQQGTWRQFFTDWTGVPIITKNDIFLSGSIAWIGALPLWLTSMEWCRRRFFTVFHRFHVLGFVIFITFANMHWPGMWQPMMAGLFVYAVDLVFRVGQASQVSAITAAKVSEDGSVLTWQLAADEKMGHCPLQHIFMNVPAISSWAWHPFTIASGSKPGTVTIYTKRFGSWTTELMQRMLRREQLAVRYAGPFGGKSTAWAEADVVVLVAGGIAVTPLLGILRELVDRAESNRGKIPRRVHLMWSARTQSEFAILHRSIASATNLKAPDGNGQWLTIELHATAPIAMPILTQSGRFADEVHKPTDVTIEDIENPKAFKDRYSPGTSTTITPDGYLADLTSTVPKTSFRHASPYFFNHPRKMLPKFFGWFHWALVHLFVFLGAFLGLLLARSYFAEIACTRVGITANKYSWQTGLLEIVLMILGALGPAYILLVFPGILGRYLVRRRQDRAEVWPTTRDLDSDHTAHLMDRAIGFPEDGLCLPIAQGRLNIAQRLAEVRAAAAAPTFQGSGRHGKCNGIAFYVAGPEPMMHAARRAVSECKVAGPPIWLRKEAWSL